MKYELGFVTTLDIFENFSRELQTLKRSPWKQLRKGVWEHSQYNGKVVFRKNDPVVIVSGRGSVDLVTKFVAWAMDHFGENISTYVIQ